VPGEILVKLRSGDALQPLLVKYPLTLVGRFGARPIFRLKVAGTVRVKDMLSALSIEPDVMIAEVNSLQRGPEARKNVAWTIGTPQAYANQWAPGAIHLPQAQAMTRGAGVRVAVIDTGVDATHPALAGHLLPGFDFVDFDADPSEAGGPLNAAYGHGTHVAGLVALAAPEARIIPIRALDADGNGNAWVLAEALLYAVDPDGNPDTDDGAQVINLSLGSATRTRMIDAITAIASCAVAVVDDPVADRSDRGYREDEARCSRGRGAVVVAAAGNDASVSVKEFPAAEGGPGWLAVAASNESGRIAAFSNYGGWIDVAAPGDAITSTVPGGAYATWGGTSMAAALTSGIAALVLASAPSMTAYELARRIKHSTAPMCGGGSLRQVDAAAALAATRLQDKTCP
jgi:subtilisin family serine protease